jgi:hypothetical protein
MENNYPKKLLAIAVISAIAISVAGGSFFALGELARAESGQTTDEVISHVAAAKRLLPESGSVSWWSPEKGDFKAVQAELDDIISRARNISTPALGNELFNSEMYDIHARLGAIQESLVEF